MSWMDNWSRPSKSQATPAPYYLLPGGEATPYCHSCGRVISTRKANVGAPSNTPVKYCSSKCKGRKPRARDREIEGVFVRMLSGGDVDNEDERQRGGNVRKGKKKAAKHVKGDPRILVTCSMVEKEVFGSANSQNTNDEKSTTQSRSPELEALEAAQHEELVDKGKTATAHDQISAPGPILNNVLADTNVDYETCAHLTIGSASRICPTQPISEANRSVGGEKGWAEKIEETDEMLEKRRIGQRKADEKERVKCAARRGVVFGFVMDGDDAGERRMCEAIMGGKVVEPSFAKGDWKIRWRE